VSLLLIYDVCHVSELELVLRAKKKNCRFRNPKKETLRAVGALTGFQIKEEQGFWAQNPQVILVFANSNCAMTSKTFMFVWYCVW
jgi:hypothetical protein